MDESHLTWLTYAFFIGEATGAKHHGTILDIIEKAYIKEETCASGTSSPFARITVDRYNIFWILLQPFVHLVNELEENMERRRVVIFPIEVGHSIVKPGGIICPLTYVENVIFVRVFLIHEFLNLIKHGVNINGYRIKEAKYRSNGGTYIFDIISPITCESRCWKAHDDNPVIAYVTQIDVVLILRISFPCP